MSSWRAEREILRPNQSAFQNVREDLLLLLQWLLWNAFEHIRGYKTTGMSDAAPPWSWLFQIAEQLRPCVKDSQVGFGHIGGFYASCILMRAPFHMVKEMPQRRDAPHWWVLKVHKTQPALRFSFPTSKKHPASPKQNKSVLAFCWDVSMPGQFMDGLLNKRALRISSSSFFFFFLNTGLGELRAPGKESVDAHAWSFLTGGERARCSLQTC